MNSIKLYTIGFTKKSAEQFFQIYRVTHLKVCELFMPPVDKKITESGNQVAELRIPQPLVIKGNTAGTCTVTVSPRGSGRSATEQITIYENNAKQP